jgi:hypothetical protein
MVKEEVGLPRGNGDPDAYGYPGEKDEPSLPEYYMHQLDILLTELEANMPHGYKDELDMAMVRLSKMLEIVERPF